MKARELAAQYGFKIGCGDNSCRFGSPGGMATNGGCQCVKSDLAELRSLIMVLGTILTRIAHEK